MSVRSYLTEPKQFMNLEGYDTICEDIDVGRPQGLLFVLDKALKGICSVRLDNRKVIRAAGPRTCHLDSRFLSVFYVV